ncbi:MAG: tRNA (adenosine(37)-N6)-dimethylallyltransferase MiaA [Aquisalimonadaceae bacterium]
MDHSLPVICLMGPTASGKTGVAVELAQRFPLDIVSVDSAMVYRGMDIGTAKPEADMLARAPHRLIDICEPTETYSAARFRDDALREIRDIQEKGRVPLLVGGTMLYFRALMQGLSVLPSADPDLRERLLQQALEHGWGALHRRLQRVDSEAAARIHRNDTQRIQRALEVYELTGRPMTSLMSSRETSAGSWHYVRWALMPPERTRLHARIEERFLAMLKSGFIDEVQRLRARGDLDLNYSSMRAVGYRQIWQYLDGRLDHAEMVRAAVSASRQFAKRQLTWLRSEPDLDWFDPESDDLLKDMSLRVRLMQDGAEGGH